ncbi:MAG: ribonuclease HI [Bacteroidia bacterium]|nr:ribonuclease HI [Bacteroidia bacterium]
MSTEYIRVYTDGACSNNPGKGGWAAILLYKNKVKKLSGGYKKTTNNRMELMAVIEALSAIKNKQLPVIVYSDSEYVVNSINKGYIYQWMSKDFKNVKNPDLWKKLISMMREFKNLRFEWVKGHANNKLNEECDKMAVYAYSLPDSHLKTDEYYESLISSAPNNK